MLSYLYCNCGNFHILNTFFTQFYDFQFRDDEAHFYLTVDINESYGDLNNVLLSIRITPVTLFNLESIKAKREEKLTIFEIILFDIHENMRCLSNKMI